MTSEKKLLLRIEKTCSKIHEIIKKDAIPFAKYDEYRKMRFEMTNVRIQHILAAFKEAMPLQDVDNEKWKQVLIEQNERLENVVIDLKNSLESKQAE